MPIPKKSACYVCPYHDDAYWLNLKTKHPEKWDKAVAFNESIRNATAAKVNNPVFLHRSLTPLPLVDLKPDPHESFVYGMQNECEGMCGV